MLTFIYLYCQALLSMFCRGRYRNSIDWLIDWLIDSTHCQWNVKTCTCSHTFCSLSCYHTATLSAKRLVSELAVSKMYCFSLTTSSLTRLSANWLSAQSPVNGQNPGCNPFTTATGQNRTQREFYFVLKTGTNQYSWPYLTTCQGLRP